MVHTDNQHPYNIHNTHTAYGKQPSGDILPYLHQIHLGNCINIMQTMPANSIDMIITDPPYLVNYQDRDGRSIAGDISDDWLIPAFAQMYRLLRHHSFAISFYGWTSIDKFMQAWKQAGFYAVGHLVFTKHYTSSTRFTHARHECAYLLAKGRPAKPMQPLMDIIPWGEYTGNHLHPTQKPVDMLADLIAHYSHADDIILDPFAGSGSSLIAARMTGRSWIGMEIDRLYHRDAVNRLAAV